MGAPPHRPHHQAKAQHAVCAIVTVSDTRTPESDASGVCIRALLEEGGHRILSYAILPDDPGRIRAHLEELFGVPGLDAVIVDGGTGLAPRDTTYEAVTGLLEKRLDGFGELFRMLSYQQVGSAAMLSRAVAGVARGKIVVSLPGAPAAVELAMQKLLLPELGHMVHLVRG
ncbi:MAG: MogA/MoaB family molybdenum cofactor biosynthesis protein [Deltaproteobacteria bacterium]|nr:MAG: MogA/MoaB family molybdenum cofactor biosynthesis protein [Deltaproteobacteria bacterium]